MHAEMRRMPVERARHAKRLGHADVGSGPNFAVVAASSNGSGTPTSVQQSATSAIPASTQTPSSTLQSSSNTLPSSSPTQSSSASTSITSSSTSSVAVSTDTKLSTSITPSSSSTIQPTIPVSTAPTPSSISTQQANSAAATNSGLSGGALAGIIAGSVIVGVAILVFFIRKTYLRRRERKRISWSGIPGMGAGFSDEPKFPDLTEQPASFTSAVNAPKRSAPLSPFEPHGQSMYSTPVSPVTRIHPSAMPTYGVPTPPPATFNNPAPVAAYPTQPFSSTYGPRIVPAFAVPRVATGIASTSPGRAQPLEAMVKCTFVPNLPDELSIMTGQPIFVIEQYDDGWALCADGRGEQGMVPRECLDLASSDQPDIGWSNMRRMSSLNPDGQRF
ncbi:hypothetical protein JVU11DRAFT_750 [Chiua virens]|nr:hypothetical protein JVU11DRAFT_750 [Chiua virens]